LNLSAEHGAQICGLVILKEKSANLAQTKNKENMLIVDNFIGDTDLLKDIAKDKTFFSQNGRYMWYD